MSPLGIKNGDGYDWGAVAADLSRMMTLADEKVKEGSPECGEDEDGEDYLWFMIQGSGFMVHDNL
jgi:hypothetical protein